MNRPPIALTIAGSDPSGGAGLQADLTTFTRLGVHGATAVTAITVQDTRNVMDFDVLSARRIVQQIEIVLADLPVAAIKIGMLGSPENVRAVADLLAVHPHIPVVLDPVMVAGGGGELATAAVVDSLREWLLPRALVITPNTP
jgi:hydroxymethylpyrimidine/phosphomethylpyrimidine kinase